MHIWLQRVAAGEFDAIPIDLARDGSLELAHLVDGYELVKLAGWETHSPLPIAGLSLAQISSAWSGGPAELWASLFLEHRRRRMAGVDPDESQRALLDRL